MSARTLCLGWWGLASLLISPVVLLLNLVAQTKIGKLPPPGPAFGPRPRPERPLTQRPEALGLLVPLAVVGLVIVLITSSSPSATRARSGDCVRWDGKSIAIVDCAAPDAQYLVLTRLRGDSAAPCELWAQFTASYPETAGGEDFVLCLAPVPGSEQVIPTDPRPGPGHGGPSGGEDGRGGADTRDA